VDGVQYHPLRAECPQGCFDATAWTIDDSGTQAYGRALDRKLTRDAIMGLISLVNPFERGFGLVPAAGRSAVSEGATGFAREVGGVAGAPRISFIGDSPISGLVYKPGVVTSSEIDAMLLAGSKRQWSSGLGATTSWDLSQVATEAGANSRSISEISVEYSQGSGKISHASMTGNVDGVPTNLGNMKYVYEESGPSKIVSVNMYEINPEFRGQGLSTKLFSDVQNYHQANMFEGAAGFENSSVLSRTGNIDTTPWAKSMNRIGFDTIYDPYMGMMTSVKRAGQ
jgi:hypothetical protein